MRWFTKQVAAWSLYDFADTAFSALFITFFFPILIKTYLGGNELMIGLTFGLSLLTAALIVPLIGAVADATGKKIPLLFIATLITVGLTALTGYVGLTVALVLGFLANVFNIIDVDLYDSQVVEVAAETDRGKVAGLGVAVGYVGTLGALLMGYLIMSRIGWETKAARPWLPPTHRGS